jgi:hypothetical protein
VKLSIPVFSPICNSLKTGNLTGKPQNPTDGAFRTAEHALSRRNLKNLHLNALFQGEL